MSELFYTEKITDRVSRICMPGNVCGYLAVGDDRAAVIDTGCGAGPLRAYVEGLLQGKPYEVILTHGHVDHAGGASEFDRVWLNEKDVPMAAVHTQKEIRFGYLQQDTVHKLTMEDLVAPKESGYLPLEYGQIFALGNETLEIVCVGGHTAGSIGVLFQEEKILLTGDACCSFTLLFGAPDSLSVSEYRDNLQKLLAEYGGQFDRMLYSHPHNWGGPEVISEMIDVCTEVLEDRDDRLAMDFMGRPGYIAKKCGEGNNRIDGKIANLVYTPNK